MEGILHKVRGVVIMSDDRFKRLHGETNPERRQVRYGEHIFEEMFVEEIQAGDTVIFAAVSDDPKEPNRIISAHVATDLQPKSAGLVDEGGAKEVTISFNAVQTTDPKAVRHARQLLAEGRAGNIGDTSFIDGLYPDTVSAFADNQRPLVDALKDMGPLHLDPIMRDVLGNTSFDYVVPIRGNTVLKARGTVEINHRTHLVIQQGDIVPPHRGSYLFIGHDHNDQPTGGFILSDVFLSEYIGRTGYSPGLPANTKWVDRPEAEKVKFDFRPEGEPQAWCIIAVHAGEIVYNDPKAVVEGIGDNGVVLQPNTPIPTERVNVLLLDYDVIPGFASCTYEAHDVDLSKIIKEGRIDVKRPPSGLPGFLIDGVIFSETLPYTFQLYGNHTNYPRFRE